MAVKSIKTLEEIEDPEPSLIGLNNSRDSLLYSIAKNVSSNTLKKIT